VRGEERDLAAEMSAAELPPEVLGLIHGPVRTFAHVELLLALYACRPDPCPSADVAKTTSATTLEGARRALAELADAGLVARTGPDEWRFAPRDAASREAVASLAAAYDRMPVPLVRALCERPAKPLQSFADAFRLRDDR
jgi:hypothetical protein